MTRLPQPGSDQGKWGEILNDFLAQSHNPDGSLKDLAKSRVIGLQEELDAKAVKTDVDAALATKVTASQVDTQITAKGYLLTSVANNTLAPITSPVFTGTPQVPTANLGTNNTQAASTGFVQATAKALLASNQRPRQLSTISARLSYGHMGLSSGTAQTAYSGQWAQIGVNAAGVRVVYANFYGANLPGPNPITIKASIEMTPTGDPIAASTSNPLTPVYFNGSRTIVIQPGQVVISDITPVAPVKGKGLYVRTYISVDTLGQKWPLGKLNNAGSIPGTGYDPATDDRISANDATDNTTSRGNSTWDRSYTPLAVLAETTTRSILLAGDSIMAGIATSPTYADERIGGFGQRAFQGKAGVINIALGAEKATGMLAAFSLRMQAAQFCTDVLTNYINNDVHETGVTFAVVAARLQQLWALFAGFGLRVHATTCTPRTTSTDSWATLENQTKHVNEPIRIAVNAWLRAGAPQDTNGLAVAPGTAGAVLNPNLTTLSDVADAIESVRDSGLWAVNGTSNYFTGDGTHPRSAAAVAMAGAVPVDAILNT